MSIEIIEKELSILEEKAKDHDEINYSSVIIPFSDIIHKIEFLDVYSGTENIPFKERDSEYKKILLTEFL
jgi:hypothetical protein